MPPTLLPLPWPSSGSVAVPSTGNLPAFIATPTSFEFAVEGGETIRFLRIHEALIVLAPPATVKATIAKAHVRRAEPIALAIENHFEIFVVTGTGHRIFFDQNPTLPTKETAFALFKDYLYCALSHGSAQAVVDLSFAITSTPIEEHASLFELLSDVSRAGSGGPPKPDGTFWSKIRELHDRINQYRPYLKLSAPWRKLARVTR